MIKLERGPKPNILEVKGEGWKQGLLEKIRAGTDKPTDRKRYRHPEIKAALIADTRGKCAYCESKLLHVHHGDVEHIHPKSLKPELTFEWENLTLACEICNQNKADADPEAVYILDPYSDDPTVHLVFLGPLVYATDAKGVSTVQILQLGRAELVERRKEKLDNTMRVLGNLFRTDLPLPVRRSILRDLRNRDASNAGEYSAVVRYAIEIFVSRLPRELGELL